MPKHGTNIRKRTDGRWEGRYKILQSDHSCKYRSVYGRTCREVKEKLEHSTAAEITSAAEKNATGKGQSLSLQQLPDGWKVSERRENILPI